MSLTKLGNMFIAIYTRIAVLLSTAPLPTVSMIRGKLGSSTNWKLTERPGCV